MMSLLKPPHTFTMSLLALGSLLMPSLTQASESSERMHQLVLDVLTADGVVESKKRSEMLSPKRLKQASAAIATQLRDSPKATAVEKQSIAGLIIRFSGEEVKALSRANLPPPSVFVEEIIRTAGVPIEYGRPMSMDSYVFQFTSNISNSDSESAINRIRTLSFVEKAFLDVIQTQKFTPNDTYAGFQYNLMSPSRTGFTGAINAGSAWDITQGSSNVVVAVVDSGVGPHPEFASRLLPGYDFVSDPQGSNDGDGRDSDATDPGDWALAGECGTNSPSWNSSWHGTHVAGIIGAKGNNSSDIAGIDWNARILPVRVMGKCGRGSTSDILDGLVWSAGISVPGVPRNLYPAKIINASLGGRSEGGCQNSPYLEAINQITAKGALLVVAAGNSASEAANYVPASCEGAFTIGAVDPYGFKASYSNFSFSYKLHLAAPGGDGANLGILSTVNSGTKAPVSSTLAPKSGTSMAAPHVAGIASLALSVDPDISPEFLRLALMLTSQSFPSTSVCSASYPVCGVGIVDATATLSGIQALKPYQLVYEFRNASTNHFFRTGSPAESSGIKGGSAGPNWYDSGDYFLAWRDATLGASPVCRFYSISFNSHFYTASTSECNSVKNNIDWQYEGIAYFAKLPVNGICPASTVPIYRLYNNRHALNDGNHRFTTDTEVASEMVRTGWKHEGVVMCAAGG